MGILNRLRGTYAYFAWVNGCILGFIFGIIYQNVYIGLAVCLGYVGGESFGWGAWVGALSMGRENSYEPNYDDGRNNGIRWLSSKIIPISPTNWLWHCRIALFLRGCLWWGLTFIPLVFVGFSFMLFLIVVIILGIGFVFACEIGYLTQNLFSFQKGILSIKGGWEHQELWYGIIQDFVILYMVVVIL
ncbi:hypothetical protein YZ82_05220 [Campylobacter hyointestinalis]|uniref:Uncharacterized protein n=1 Tax=Campylobacter hyointestinalis TaxID=198 RepID=A0A562XBL6_CAMHY|nr:hypothetical protein [Campylobacter hyointestinalis]TWO19507.1 hypothetical protein YZ82_05220 [Campylobacter hyointestinalis]